MTILKFSLPRSHKQAIIWLFCYNSMLFLLLYDYYWVLKSSVRSGERLMKGLL